MTRRRQSRPGRARQRPQRGFGPVPPRYTAARGAGSRGGPRSSRATSHQSAPRPGRPPRPGARRGAGDRPGDVDPVGRGRCDPRPRWSRASTRRPRPWGAGHRGRRPAGRARPAGPRRAARHGVVRRRVAGRGVVIVDHGDTRTTYEPVALARRASGRGRRRRRARPARASRAPTAPRGPACTGGGCAATTYLDPLGLVGAGPVRLLPLDGAARRRARRAGAARPRRTSTGSRSSTRRRLARLSTVRRGGAPAGRPSGAGPW